MTDIGPKRFRLIFRGQLEPDTDPDQARALFRERFRVAERTLEHCFSGRKVAVRSELSEADAFRLQADLQEQGLVTRIEAMPGAGTAPPTPPLSVENASPATPAQPATRRSAPEPPSTVPPESRCRHCNEPVLPRALHCPWCGGRQRERGGLWPALAGLALLALLALPLVSLVIMPVHEKIRTGDQVAAAVRQGEATAEHLRAFMQRTGFRPNSNLDAGLPEPGKLAEPPLASIRVSSGALITLRFKPGLEQLGGRTLVFQPSSGDHGEPTWLCRPGTLDAALLPPRCRPAKTDAPPPPKADTRQTETADHDRAGLVRRVVREEIELSRSIRERMTEYRETSGEWPRHGKSLGLPDNVKPGTSAVRQMRVLPGGKLEMEFVAAIMGDRSFSVTLHHNGRDWMCRADIDPVFLPENCQRDPAGSR